MSDRYLFEGFDEAYEVAETIPDAERHEIYAHNTETDDWNLVPWRHSIYLEDGRGPAGDVSASDDWYTISDFGDIFESVITPLEEYEDAVTPKGNAYLSQEGSTFDAYIDLEGVAIEPFDGDVHELGIYIDAGHTGAKGISMMSAAMRQICSNGEYDLVADQEFYQDHQRPLDYTMGKQVVDAVMHGSEVVEQRLQDAHEERFVNREEALLTLLETPSAGQLDSPVEALEDALDAETDSDQPSLYETYQALTRAVTHESDLSHERRNRALRQASELIDQDGALPDPADLSQEAIERRVDEYSDVDDEEVEQYWADERETLSDLIERRGDGG